MRTAAVVLAVAFVASLTAPLGADPGAHLGDEGEGLALSADTLEVDLEAKTAVLSGHVAVKKGAVSVGCSRVDVRFDEVPHVTWIKGSGGVVADVKGIRAEAPEFELDLGRQQLDLRGGVRLSKAGGWITAERASVQVVTGKITMSDVKGVLPARPPPK